MLPQRRAILRTILAAGIAAPTQCSWTPQAWAQEPTLAALAAARGLLFGMAVTREQLQESPKLADIAASQSRMVVPGLELKWSRVQPGPNQFEFADADAVMGFAAQHGLLTRGHTLVWHEALPPWVNDTLSSQQMGSLLWAHIHTVASRYSGRMHSWDVVNEVIEPGQRGPGGLRASPFLRALGPGYVELAFRLAAEADPKALLVINEYDLEMDTPSQARRRAAMLDLLNRLVQRGAPVHALGIQAHLLVKGALFDPDLFRSFIRSVASLGLQVFITELDVLDRELPADPATRDQDMARAVRDYLGAALAETAVRLVTTWGVSDRYTWVNDSPQFRRRDGLPARPHLYDTDFQPKPVWGAVAEAFRAAPNRPAA